MNAYGLVLRGMELQNLPSERQFALKNGLNPQNVVDWKRGKSMPTWENLEKLANANSMKTWEAVKFMEESQESFKQAGFSTLPMMSLLGAGSVGAMSLLNMTSLSNGLIPLGVFATFATLYTLYEV